MEGFGNRAAIRSTQQGIAAALAFVLMILVPAAAHADRRDTTSGARSHHGGVDFSIREVTNTRGDVAAGASGVSCDYDLQLGTIGAASGYWKRALHRTSMLAHRTCTDGTDDFVWVDACGFVDLGRMCSSSSPRGVDPVAVAREVRDRLPVSGLGISSNPRRGLVGVKSWFWVVGGGRPLSDSLSAFGVRVDVEARPTTYRWDFGDGTAIQTNSPGRPYPKRSPARHAFERSSAGHPDGYRVTVITEFEVRWRVNGGRWAPLEGITGVSERFYRVAESQAVNSDG